MAAIRTIGRHLSAEYPRATTALRRRPFPDRPAQLPIRVTPDHFDRMVEDIARVRGDLERIAGPDLRRVYSLAGHLSWLGARKARLDAGYAGVGTRITAAGMRREATSLSGDMADGIRHYARVWRTVAAPGALPEVTRGLRAIARSLAPARFRAAQARRAVTAAAPHDRRRSSQPA